uniref:Adipocyte plasma membrane-associated protein n=1 Tax=Panagrellus redivivus TaxID=6233 RepID=A0A7E4W6B8_PANRE
MNHVAGFLLIVFLLIGGFIAITGVFIFMINEPDPNEKIYQQAAERMENRKQMLRIDSSQEVQPTERIPLRTLSTVLLTTTTPLMTDASTSAKPLTPPPLKYFDRASPVTVRVNNIVFQGLERPTTTAPKEIQAYGETRLSQVFELHPPHNQKISTILIRQNLLYLPLANGDIVAYNVSDYKPVHTINTSLVIHHLGFLANGKMVATEMRKSTLSILDENGFIEKQLNLDYDSKDMQVFNDEIYVLSRTNRNIFIYDSSLRFKRDITFDNELQETCNFIRPIEDAIFISCQSAVLEVTQIGRMIQKYSIPGGSYSLAINLLHDSLLAVVRGKPELHAFDRREGHLLTRFTSSEHKTAIWSALAIHHNKLYALEYVRNVVHVFYLP